MTDVIDVVIPARNEADTIGDIVLQFANHPAIGKVWIGIDRDDIQKTGNGLTSLILDTHVRWIPYSGKGQVVTELLKYVTTPYVIFCDADIRGLTDDHIGLLIAGAVFDEQTVTIGVPDIPANYPTSRLWAWPWVSGQRCVPTALVRPLKLHGYLMETQINAATRHAGMPVRFEWLKGVKSDYNMSQLRMAEMQRDAAYGRRHGIL